MKVSNKNTHYATFLPIKSEMLTIGYEQLILTILSYQTQLFQRRRVTSRI